MSVTWSAILVAGAIGVGAISVLAVVSALALVAVLKKGRRESGDSV